MDHIVHTFGHHLAFLGTIKENCFMEVAVANMTNHTTKQLNLVEVILRDL